MTVAVCGLATIVVHEARRHELLVQLENEGMVRVREKVTTGDAAFIVVESRLPDWISERVPAVWRESWFVRIRSFQSDTSPTRAAWLSDVQVRALQTFRELEHVNISSAVSREGFAALAAMPNLRSLSVCDEMWSSSGFGHSAGYERLERLDLMGVDLTDEALRGIVNCKTLRSLWLENRFDTATFQAVGRCRDLNELSLWASETRVTADNLAALKGLKKLKSLDLSGLEPGALNGLPPLSQLVELDLCDEPTLSDVKALSRLPRLKRVNIESRRLYEECEQTSSLPKESVTQAQYPLNGTKFVLPNSNGDTVEVVVWNQNRFD